MKFKKLGNTDLNVSTIAFGTWPLGGNSYGPVDSEQALKILRHAFDLGVNFYDTSDLYGDGRSETLLGSAFLKSRDKVIICSKFGMLPHTGKEMPQDFSISHLHRALEGSLRRLRTDYIDLYLLHSPPREVICQELILDELKQLKAQGKIRHFGISAKNPDDAKYAVLGGYHDVAQVNYNLIDHRCIDNGFFNSCQKQNIGVIARTPLCFGFLTGAFKPGMMQFTELDHRNNWPKNQLDLWAEAPKLFEKLAETLNLTSTELALLFCLSHPAISTVIPGMMSKQEVNFNASVANRTPLVNESIRKIREIYRNNIFFEKNA